jgi:signal transduction histidine kinase
MSEFEILAKIIEISHLEETIESKLEKIANYLKDKLELSDIHFLLFKKEDNMFDLNYSTNEKLLNKCNKVSANDGALLGIAESKNNVFINNFSPDTKFKSGLLKLPSAGINLFAIPVFNVMDFFGVVLGEKRGEFTKLDEKLLSLISEEITGMISSASSYIELSEKVHELSTFFSISRLFVRNEDLDNLCNRIVGHISTLLYTSTVVLELFVPHIEDIAPKKYVYNKERPYQTEGPLIKGIIEEVKRTCQPIYIKDSSVSERCKGYSPDFLSALFTPIEYNAAVMGVIGLIDKETNFFVTERHFSENDLRILISLSNQLANFVENAIMTKERERLLDEKEIKTRELGILYDVSKAMMTTMKLDNLLYKILTAVTVSGGLGFNRAGLFLVNHKMNALQGMLGIGPDSGEEANRIWSRLKMESKTLLQKMTSEYIKEEGKSKFDENIKSMRIYLDEDEEALIQTIKQKKAILVTSTSEYIKRSKYIEKLNSDSYAVVPLIAKDKVLGAIFVDNSITKRPITDEDLNFLTLFANQAGLAIENSTLYSNLKKTNSELRDTHDKLLHSEKLAALGEMAADIAHEIKNPLTAIGGFARRLDKRFNGDMPEKTYINIIIKEVSRLEKVLNEILNFSKGEKVDNFRLNNVNTIINETLIIFDNEFLENNISVETDLQPDLPNVKCDYQQLKQAVINLINNSCQAMPTGGTLTINTKNGSLLNKDSVIIKIGDTGGGVGNDVIHNIFNPFFTTKNGGTGLGLAITHRLIANHSGSIEVNNRPGTGVTFIINLPIIKEEINNIKMEDKNEQKSISS